MPDHFLDHASQNEQLAKAGLDVNGLLKIIRDMITTLPLNNEFLAK